MNWSGISDPNTNIRLHCGLLAFALINVFYGIAFLSIPLVAWVLARWIVMAFSAMKRKAEEQAVAEWNGRYFAYDDKQVRVHWDDAGAWVEADDVFRLLPRRPDQRLKELIRQRLGAERFCMLEGVERECLSESAVLDYLGGLSGQEAHKIRRWLERDVFPNICRLREMNADAYKRYRLDGEA